MKKYVTLLLTLALLLSLCACGDTAAPETTPAAEYSMVVGVLI